MAEASRSNRPTPRTGAAIEAELRRRIRTELAQARGMAEDGQLDDATLASVIAGAIGAALGWHLESPEHARNATLSSRTWRPAGGPRGGGRAMEPEERGFEERAPRQFDRRPRQFEERGPNRFDERPPRPYGERPPRDFQDRDAPPPRGPRDGRRPPPRGGGGGGFSRGGGFGRKPPRRSS